MTGELLRVDVGDLTFDVRASGPWRGHRERHSFRQAFPDLRLQVVDSVVDDDRVAVWMRLSGTHRGIFRGHAPTGRRRKALGIIPDDVR